MTLVTWNVLHRVHAENYSEPAIAAWPDEAARQEAVARYVAGLDARVVCLQEVSGDQLTVLRRHERGEVLAWRYPRVPSLRQPGTAFADIAEYLVTVVREPGAAIIQSEAFATDGGKGLLGVRLADGITVFNVHISFGDWSEAQLTHLAATARASPGMAVLCGDFNADAEACTQWLGSDFTAAKLKEPSLPTRPRADRLWKSQLIDHVFVRGGEVEGAVVLDGGGRSDHNPVRARFGSQW